MSMDSVIKIMDLHFSYGGPKILENIEIDIQRNEFIGMVGPNGSGRENGEQAKTRQHEADRDGVHANHDFP